MYLNMKIQMNLDINRATLEFFRNVQNSIQSLQAMMESYRNVQNLQKCSEFHPKGLQATMESYRNIQNSIQRACRQQWNLTEMFRIPSKGLAGINGIFQKCSEFHPEDLQATMESYRNIQNSIQRTCRQQWDLTEIFRIPSRGLAGNNGILKKYLEFHPKDLQATMGSYRNVQNSIQNSFRTKLPGVYVKISTNIISSEMLAFYNLIWGEDEGLNRTDSMKTNMREQRTLTGGTTSVVCRCGKVCKNHRGLKIHQTKSGCKAREIHQQRTG
ncbi:hypothetical protein MAR_009349 [Mya arenaria]|uniref:Uncharacterized protein n=1 Tax=Mya arenaria TaxID=6604 RepID=A0ABY7E2Q6_MYAAR|nr:hypothetical protein MAR_009349 [Mya arenaria]